MKTWYTYLVRCKDNTLYCGVTTDIKRRVKEHNSRIGSKYTISRRPVSCVGYLTCTSRSEACKVEARIKSWTKEHKEKFVRGEVVV